MPLLNATPAANDFKYPDLAARQAEIAALIGVIASIDRCYWMKDFREQMVSIIYLSTIPDQASRE